MSREAVYPTVESVPRRIFLQWWAGEVSWCENRIDEREHLDVEYVHVDDYAALEADRDRLLRIELLARGYVNSTTMNDQISYFDKLRAALEEGGDG